MAIQVTPTEIPRRKTSSGGEGGPLVLPPGAVHHKGKKKCETCGRMVAADRAFPRKGTCKCLYCKRTTTFIDVLQDEYLLKQWGKRNVAWGMAQRPDLQLSAAACKPDSFYATGDPAGLEDKRELNRIAAEAGTCAGDMYKATIGSSLHRLTHQMDRGEELGFIPERWRNDVIVYADTIKSLGIEWVSVESFRVLDTWVKHIDDCNHKAIRYGGACECFGVAGTVDRIGWYNGKLHIFDIKTGSDFNKLGHAMQLAAYAHMTPYDIATDTRGSDVAPVDLSVGYIIYLPEGSGSCKLEAMNLETGWRACELAKQIWEARDWEAVIERDVHAELYQMASKATTLAALKLHWKVWAQDGLLTEDLRTVMKTRAAQLKSQGVTA